MKKYYNPKIVKARKEEANKLAAEERERNVTVIRLFSDDDICMSHIQAARHIIQILDASFPNWEVVLKRSCGLINPQEAQNEHSS